MAGKNQNVTTFPNMIGMQQMDYNAGWNGWQSKPDAFEERGKQILADVANRMKEVEAQYAQYQKADAKANRNLRVPMAPNNTAKLQKALWEVGAFQGVKDRRGREATYKTAVDGLTGRMTRAAIANAQKAGYTVDEKTGVLTKAQAKSEEAAPQNVQQSSQQPVRKQRRNGLANMYGMTHAAATGGMSNTIDTQKSQGRDVEDIIDFFGNNPALILLEDLDRANSNYYAEKLFGVRPFKGRTITSLPSMQMEELKKQVQYAKSKGRNYFNNSMHQGLYGYNYASAHGENGQDRSGFWNRMNTPKGRLEHTIGAYNFYEDENGDTIVEDTYDYNVGQRQAGDGRYASMRNFAGEFASKSTDPAEGKIKYRINLGKIN